MGNGSTFNELNRHQRLTDNTKQREDIVRRVDSGEDHGDIAKRHSVTKKDVAEIAEKDKERSN